MSGRMEGFDTTDNSASQGDASASTRRFSARLSAAEPPSSSCMLQLTGCSHVPSWFDREKTRLDPMIRKCKISQFMKERMFTCTNVLENCQTPSFDCNSSWDELHITFRLVVLRLYRSLLSANIHGNFYTPPKFP